MVDTRMTEEERMIALNDKVLNAWEEIDTALLEMYDEAHLSFMDITISGKNAPYDAHVYTFRDDQGGYWLRAVSEGNGRYVANERRNLPEENSAHKRAVQTDSENRKAAVSPG